MSFNEGDWLAYRQANLLFAEVVRQHVHPGDIVWVQGAWVLEWSWRTRLTRGMQTITSALFRAVRHQYLSSFVAIVMNRLFTLKKNCSWRSVTDRSPSAQALSPAGDRLSASASHFDARQARWFSGQP